MRIMERYNDLKLFDELFGEPPAVKNCTTDMVFGQSPLFDEFFGEKTGEDDSFVHYLGSPTRFPSEEINGCKRHVFYSED